MIKHLVFLLLSTFSLSINAQVKIDVVGDNWEQVVHNALTLIKETDSTTYKFVTSNCNHIGFWNGNYSTTEGKSIFLTIRFAIKMIRMFKNLWDKNNLSLLSI